jgi:3-oxoacyl-[acyl-carrier protein] reductase
MKKTMLLENRVAVISGATGGLGRVVSKFFAEQGAHLALIGNNPKKINALTDEIGLADKKILPISIDVSNPKSAQEAKHAVISKFDQIDIYLHLVGGWIGGNPVVEVEENELNLMLKQHLWSTFYMAKAIIPHLLQNEWGRIIVISSPSAHHPPGKNSPYAVAKAAQEALIFSIAKELKGSGVTANILSVKMIDTEHEKIKNPSKKNQSWTTPEEITNTILHLCTDKAGIINGARIPLFGDNF